jgi:WD40 repeat protein
MNPGDGAVTSLAFHHAPAASGPSYLLNGSSDGSVSVWQASSNGKQNSRSSILPRPHTAAALCMSMVLAVGSSPAARDG